MESGLDNTIYTSCLKNAIFEEELYKAENKLHFSRADFFSHEFKHVLHIGSVIYNMYNIVLPLLNSGKNVIFPYGYSIPAGNKSKINYKYPVYRFPLIFSTFFILYSVYDSAGILP